MDSLTSYTMMDKIFEISDLKQLNEYLSRTPDLPALREQLFDKFLKYSEYRNAEEWNIAVRICEALAIIGWGDHEPVEAIRNVYLNGNPNTFFINRNGKARFFDAVWSKRKEGLTIDFERSFFHGSPDWTSTTQMNNPARNEEIQDVKLNSQRNWIPKNPIRITRGIANCYKATKPVVDSINDKLIPKLNRNMRPELYGTTIDSIIFDLSFSFYDNYHCKTNHIIADESLKLKQKDFYPKLLEMYSEKEIKDNGYYLRNRFTYGPFRRESGTVRIRIVFEKEFSQLSTQGQKHMLSEYLLHAINQIANRLERKISYDFQLMISDFKSILTSWLKQQD